MVENPNKPTTFPVGSETGNADDHGTAIAHAPRHVELDQVVVQRCVVENVEYAHWRRHGNLLPSHVTVRVDNQFYAVDLHVYVHICRSKSTCRLISLSQLAERDNWKLALDQYSSKNSQILLFSRFSEQMYVHYKL